MQDDPCTANAVVNYTREMLHCFRVRSVMGHMRVDGCVRTPTVRACQQLTLGLLLADSICPGSLWTEPRSIAYPSNQCECRLRRGDWLSEYRGLRVVGRASTVHGVTTRVVSGVSGLSGSLAD